ncbi:MAG: YcxB family protein [Clostridiales bacterium]|nr:YcxB family protein [Clostridiales bacterium]
MSEQEQNETMNVTIEEMDEEESRPIVETTTVIDERLVHVLAKSAVRRDQKSEKRRPIYTGLAIAILVLAAYLAYTYFITKTNTTRGPVMIIIMVIMAITLLRYLRTPLIDTMERRMQPYLGQAWHYVISDDGITLTLNGQEALFKWEEITGWWLEDGCYMMEVAGQAIVFRQDSLDEDEEEDLKELLYVYLGDAMSVENLDESAENPA